MKAIFSIVLGLLVLLGAGYFWHEQQNQKLVKIMLKQEVETLQSSAGECSLLAEQLYKNKITSSFQKIQAQYLLDGIKKSKSSLTSSQPEKDIEEIHKKTMLIIEDVQKQVLSLRETENYNTVKQIKTKCSQDFIQLGGIDKTL